MIVIADSGSTKTDWIISSIPTNPNQTFATKGLNPNVHNDATLLAILSGTPQLMDIADQITQLHFYGAGCGTAINQQRILLLLQQLFAKAQISVKADINGAVFSVCGSKPAIVAILGTGSNSCYTDGENVFANDFSLGFILGDEGSGSYFGKRLLRDYFYQLLPEPLTQSFKETYGLTRDELIERVYQSPAPNEFIASFLPFFAANKTHPYCKYFIEFGLMEFLKIYILRFENYKNVPVHFVGSVAHVFDEELRRCCEELSIIVGQIIKHPIEQLLQYHLQ